MRLPAPLLLSLTDPAERMLPCEVCDEGDSRTRAMTASSCARCSSSATSVCSLVKSVSMPNAWFFVWEAISRLLLILLKMSVGLDEGCICGRDCWDDSADSGCFFRPLNPVNPLNPLNILPPLLSNSKMLSSSSSGGNLTCAENLAGSFSPNSVSSELLSFGSTSSDGFSDFPKTLLLVDVEDFQGWWMLFFCFGGDNSGGDLIDASLG
mmetsp:Transcript_29089/g.60606  ORF Transcript_29089/g.60606 Transcript_29089/m.60606 type:complete len:209 (+) Transcript_29089:1716-2342(+)